MTETTKEKPKIPPQVVREDVPKIIVPEGLRFRDAATYCTAKADEEEAKEAIITTIGLVILVLIAILTIILPSCTH